MDCDLLIVGGGVAGLMASGVAAQSGLRVVVLEKMEKPARKLRITGKGRCNITNSAPLEQFADKINHGAEFLQYALEQFDNQSTVQFFRTIGIEVIEERGGRIFPKSGSAVDVALALEKWAKLQGVNILCKRKVQELLIQNSSQAGGADDPSSDSCGSLISGVSGSRICGVKLADGEVINARSVLLATGGVSYPSTGSDGDGHQMAYDAGHTIEPLRPALVPLIVKENIDELEGLKLINTAVELIVNGEVAQSLFGEVEFLDKMAAGSCILQLSSQAVDSLPEGKKVELRFDLKPALSTQKFTNRLQREIDTLAAASANFSRAATFRILLQKIIPSPLHSIISERVAVPLNKPLNSLDQNSLERLVAVVKSLSLSVVDYAPFSRAIITQGGVVLSEVNPLTMESTIIKGLYFAGELLDIDAKTGGYNIQLALSTAHLAAESVANSLKTFQ